MHHGGIIFDGEGPTCEGKDPVYPGDESPSLPGGSAGSGTEDGKDIRDYLAKSNTDSRSSHEQGGNESHKDGVVHTSGMDSDAPASIGQIHDVFAEYEETCGLSRPKRKAAHSTLHNHPEGETADSIPRGVIQAEPRDAEEAAEAAGDGSTRLSKRDIESESTLQSRMEIDGQEIETLGAKSQAVPALVGDHRSGKLSSPCHLHQKVGWCSPFRRPVWGRVSLK